MSEDHIISEKYTHNGLTYFFDIRKSKRDELYIRITQRNDNSSEFEYQRIFIFEDAINQFIDTFVDVLEKYHSLTKEKVIISQNIVEPENKTAISAQITDKSSNDSSVSNKKFTFAEIRTRFEKAYRPWSKEDDDKLEILFCEKKSVQELSKIFGRTSGSIRSRIAKLEFIDKYPT
ncbi:MAG: DUF3276 family protein [Ignavibacteriae bacterium]|nr:DUF3276 family protein [Ignavibacteriota bacterium]